MFLPSDFFPAFLTHSFLTSLRGGRLRSYASLRFSPAGGLVSINPSAISSSVTPLFSPHSTHFHQTKVVEALCPDSACL